MKSGRLVAAACLASLLGSGCATIVKDKRNDVLFSAAPSDLRVFASGVEVPLVAVNKGATDGQASYTARIANDVKEVKLQSRSTEFAAPIRTHVGAGWVVADVLLTFGGGLIVDAVSGRWTEIDDIDVGNALSVAQKGGQTSAPAIYARADVPQGEPPIRERDDSASKESAAPVRPKEDAPAPTDGSMTRGKLAVLDLKSYAKEFKPEDVRYFTDLVRGVTLRSAANLEVMTRENLLVLLQASGKDLGACEGECEVDTGRRIGADAVISGEVLKVGSRYKMSLKLHDTKTGRLLSTSLASGKTIDDLDESAQKAAEELFHPKR